jgi:hypothetical protein
MLGCCKKFLYSSVMNIRLLPNQEARLIDIAAQRGMTEQMLVQQIIRSFLAEHPSPAKSAADNRGGLGTELAALFAGHGLDAPLESPFDPPKKAAGLRPADSRGRLSPHKPSPKALSKARKKRA